MPAPMQAANIAETCRAFGNLPIRHLRRAVSAGELQTYSSGGRRAVLLFDDVKAWLRTRPAPSRNQTKENQS